MNAFLDTMLVDGTGLAWGLEIRTDGSIWSMTLSIEKNDSQGGDELVPRVRREIRTLDDLTAAVTDALTEIEVSTESSAIRKLTG